MNDNMGHGGGDSNGLIPMGASDMGGQQVRTVNLRDLHAFLENRDHFATWVKDRVRQYGFAEGVDFVTFSEVSEKGGRPSVDYHGTLDMAKELAMVERNEKGKQARLYFIECERQVKEGPALPDLSDPLVLQHLLADHLSKRIEAERRAVAAEKIAEEASEKAVAHDRIAGADGSMCITDAAKALQHPPKVLFAYLRANGWVYSRPGKAGDIAYQDKIKLGLLEHKVTVVTRPDGTEKTTEQVRVTSKGLAKLSILPIGNPPANSNDQPDRDKGRR
ncbi:phage antirepressor KilAC domain-containing protein [Azospirillum doebereinerae]|uniref:phage antirepressor KilAC domain-containing protein n=1 Tax=Azospirillum doebereinerae TaxID=92933 RepID=UPI001EE58280|nr:phage antirepressor KilAC domain-containing protein [Azospirillum doebereinerae]MCG5241403.1 phage antirepressor KilAC domain-containing protein [Azospirillum doebereinerae]